MAEKINKVKLLQKVLKLKESVTYLQKGAKGPQFDYVSSDQVLAAVNDKMNELGLLIITSVTGTRLLQFTTKSGSPQFMTEVDMVMAWVDTDTGEEYAVPFYGQGVDNGEKSPGKAYTYAEKYFILKQLNVPTSKDDPDSFQQKHETVEQKASKKEELIAELKVTDSLTRVSSIWADNQVLKGDAKFKAAVKAAGERLTPKDTKPKDKEPEAEPAPQGK